MIITQKVRDDYRGLELGHKQLLLNHISPDAKVILYPSTYYSANFPQIVYVHSSGEVGITAPLTRGTMVSDLFTVHIRVWHLIVQLHGLIP